MFRKIALGLIAASPVYHLTLTAGDWLTQTCSKEPLNMAGLSATVQSSLPYIQRSMWLEIAVVALLLGVFAALGSQVRLRWPALLPVPVRE